MQFLQLDLMEIKKQLNLIKIYSMIFINKIQKHYNIMGKPRSKKITINMDKHIII